MGMRMPDATPVVTSVPVLLGAAMKARILNPSFH
jgi:hypothetical protein